MTEYQVIDHFEWGRLKLEKGQIIVIEDQGDGMSLVSLKHYPEKNQPVGTNTIETMIALKKIKKY